MGYDLIDLKYFPAETWLWEHMTLEFETKGNCCFFLFKSPNPSLTVSKPAALKNLVFLFLFFTAFMETGSILREKGAKERGMDEHSP